MDKSSILQEIVDGENIFLAYLRVKEYSKYSSYFNDNEIRVFEMDLEDNINNIRNEIIHGPSTSNLEEYVIIRKIKNYNKETENLEENLKPNDYSRPLVRMMFYQEVLIQSIFNVVFDEMAYQLPSFNYGIVNYEQQKGRIFNPWFQGYRRFDSHFKNNMKFRSKFQYCYKFDLKQFYPTINTEKLIELINESIEHRSDYAKISEWVKSILNLLSQSTKQVDTGLPQGPIFSQFLSILYIKDLKNNLIKEFRKKVQDTYEVDNIIDFFMYVDDGFIFLKHGIEEKNIQALEDSLVEVLEEALKTIDSNLEINADKSYLMRLDALNVEQILLSKMQEISRSREIMIPNQYYKKHERDNIKKSAFSHLRLLNSSKETVSTKTNQLIEQTLEMASKRSISKLSKFKTDKDEFEKEVNQYLNLTINEEEVDFFTIDEINFEYVFSNLVDRGQSAEMFHILFSKLESIIKQLENSKIKNNLELILYYKIIKYKFLFSVDFDKYELTHIQAKNFAEETLKYTRSENPFLLISIFQFAHIKWIRVFRELLIQEPNYKITIQESLKPYSLKFLEKINSYEYEGAIDAHHNALIINSFQSDEDKNHRKFYKESFKINFNQSIKKLTQKEFNKIDIYRIRDENNIVSEIEVTKKSEQINFKLENYTKFSTETLKDLEATLLVYNLYKFWYHRNSEGTLNLSLMRHDNIFIPDKEFRNNKEKLIKYNIIILEDQQDFFNHYSKHIPDQEFQKILLELFEKIFDCKAFTYTSNSGGLLQFWKFRIKVALENPKFNISEFLRMLKELFSNIDLYFGQIDSGMLEANQLFKYFFYNKNSLKYTDKLLQIHYYYANIWRNGSKELFYYTLHDQSHAITLISQYKKLYVETSGRIHTNPEETFLLFASCYLHDIGMLTGTDLETLKSVGSKESNVMMNKYKKDIEKHALVSEKGRNDGKGTVGSSRVNIKPAPFMHTLFDIHHSIDEILENKVRREHAVEAARIIKDIQILPLSNAQKKIIALVSYNHNEDREIVAGIRDKRKYDNKIVDVRKISLILRLLDLMDVGKNRVTQEVFDVYSSRMSLISKYHWLNHLSVDEVKFEIELIDEKDEDGIFQYDGLIYAMNLKIIIVFNYLPDELLKLGSSKVKNNVAQNKVPKRNLRKLSNSDLATAGENEKAYILYPNSDVEPQLSLLNLYLNEHQFIEDEIAMLNQFFGEELKIDAAVIYKANQNYFRNDFPLFKDGELYGVRGQTANELLLEYFKKN